MDYYPDWLGRDLLADTFPWERSAKTSLVAFLSEYTLHDSYCIGLYLEPAQAGTLVVRWDTFWTKDRVPFPGSQVAEWPILVIRLAGVVSVLSQLQESGIAGAESALADPSGASPQLSGLHRTTIEDHMGGFIEILHAPEVRLLCLSRDREVLEVAM